FLAGWALAIRGARARRCAAAPAPAWTGRFHRGVGAGGWTSVPHLQRAPARPPRARPLGAPSRLADAHAGRCGRALRERPALPGGVVKAMWADASQGILDAVSEADCLREAELASLSLPLRLIWGARDRLLPPGTLDFFRRALPAAEVTVLENAGHLPHLEAPRA